MKQSLTIKRTAHYHLQIPKGEIKSIVFVIHGYAQLAEEFIREFEELKEINALVVAPEALSKFYNKERKPVANWMTSHEREDEIKDYINYLNELSQHIFQKFGVLPIATLGFSQGVSTLMRWLAQINFQINEVHLCSGSIPPELKKDDLTHLNQTKFNYYYGNQDRLLKPEKASKEVERILTLVEESKYFPFEGRHEVHQTTIDQLKAFAKAFDK